MSPQPTLADQANQVLEAVARQFYAELHGAITFEDLRSMGAVGAATALARWDGRGSFGPFAVQRIRWAILDELRREMRRQKAPRARHEIAGVLATQEAAEAADRETDHVLQEPEPTLDDLCRDAAAAYYVEVTAGPGDGDALSADEQVERDSERIRVRRAISSMPPPLGQVVERHVYQGESFHEIGQALGMGKATAGDVYMRAVRWLREAFTEPKSPAAGPPEASPQI